MAAVVGLWLLAMAALTDAQLYAITERNFGDLGPETVTLMYQLAKKESGGDPTATNLRGRDRSYGIWQINIHPEANPDLARYDLLDPEQNAQAARIVLERQGPQAWSTYTQVRSQPMVNDITAGLFEGDIPPGFGSQAGDQRFRSAIQPQAGGGAPPGSESDQFQGIDLPLGWLRDQFDLLADMQIGQQTGYIPGSYLGLEGMFPTLARDIFNDDIQRAERQYQLDLSRFGLETAQFNFMQRQTEAQTKLQSMSLLASLRGPENALQYDYALQGLNAPQGQQADPFNLAQGVNQPFQPAIAPPQTQPPPQAPVAPTIAAPPVTPQPQPYTTPSFELGGRPPHFQQNEEGRFPSLEVTPEESQRVAGRAGELYQPQAGQPDFDFQINERGDLVAVPKAAGGGMFPGAAIVGDGPKPSEELAMAIGDQLIVIPLDKLMNTPKAQNGGVFGSPLPGQEPQPTQQRSLDIQALLRRFGLPSAQEGGVFPGLSRTTFGSEAFYGSPTFEQLRGQRPRNPFAAGNTIPNRGVPTFGQLNLSRYLDLLPSQQGLYQNIVESPTALGGLGINFADNLMAARRAAFSGSGATPSLYGR